MDFELAPFQKRMLRMSIIRTPEQLDKVIEAIIDGELWRRSLPEAAWRVYLIGKAESTQIARPYFVDTASQTSVPPLTREPHDTATRSHQRV